MSDAWKQWEGQVIDGKFALRRFLASTDHSAVFLTDRGDSEQKLAIKFIQLDEPLGERQLARWRKAEKLSHPNLLRLFECGRCRLGEFDLLYVLLEYAEENLAQFLPQRPLTPAEARDVVTPALQALGFLHSESLIHGRVKPSNILAIEDQLKLSSDTIFAAHSDLETDDPVTPLRPASPYDAPEVASGGFTAASDIWSLGMTLVETLTQRLPACDPASRLDPAVPDTLPAVYLDVARQCLRRDPAKRWSVTEISARLNPGSASRIPAIVSAPVVAETPVAIQPAQAAEPAAPKVDRPRPVTYAQPAPVHSQTAVRSAARRYDMSPPKLERPPLLGKLPKFNYMPIIVIAAVVLVAFLAGPRLLRHSSSAESADTAEPTPRTSSPTKNGNTPVAAKTMPRPAAKGEPARNASTPEKEKQRKSEPPASSVKKASETQPILEASHPAAASKSNAETARPVTSRAEVSAPGGFQNGEVLNQVLPDVSAKARATIHGTVRVGIKLYVDAAGNVVRSEVASQGPSPYFAEQARVAAEKWDFAPAKADGHAVNSEWLVRFQFKAADTHAMATQTAP
jgi:TonB family protein